MQSELTNEDKLKIIDMPSKRRMKQLLEEWMKWIDTYGSLIGTGSELESLYGRTKEAVTKFNGS